MLFLMRCLEDGLQVPSPELCGSPSKKRVINCDFGAERLTCSGAESRAQVRDCAVQVLSQGTHGRQNVVTLAVHAAETAAMQHRISLHLTSTLLPKLQHGIRCWAAMQGLSLSCRGPHNSYEQHWQCITAACLELQ